MREFKSLIPSDRPDSFDHEIHGEEPIVKVEESKEQIVISYIFPGFYISNDARDVSGERIPFKQVNIARTGFLAEGGKPLLPSFGRYVQIPFNCDYEFKVKKGTEQQFDDVVILPAQEMLTDEKESKPEFEYDKETYSSDEFYPESLVEIKGPFEIDGYNSLVVHVRPLQYNPLKKKIRGFGNISVTITLTAKKGKPDTYPLMDPEADREAFGNTFVNPKRRVEERVEMLPGPIVIPSKPCKHEFLIIYHDALKKAAQKLTNWKNVRGLRTKMVPITEVHNSVPEIKDYIRKRRKTLFSRLRYVLLMGDVDVITPETIVGGVWGDNVSDYYYSTSKDPADANDYVLPWLSIGRIPVRDVKQAIEVVDQIIKYERNPPCDPEYYRRMAFAAYFQDNNGDGKADRAYMKTMEDIRDHMTSLGFDVERINVSNNPNPQLYIDGTPIPAAVLNSIMDGATATDVIISATAEGQLIIGHRDHGSSSGWSHPSFTRDNIDTITSEYPSVFYSVNCLTGKYDLPAPTESFAEHLLSYRGGAPSLIAATRLSHTWLNNDLMKALFDAMWAGMLPTFPASTASYSVRHNRLGDILNYGKSYLPVTMSGGSQYIKDHFEIYHIFGDPTLELWKSEPITVNMTARLIKNYLTVVLSTCPKDSVITVWYKGKEIKRIQPSSTHIKISLRGFPEFPLLRGRRKVVVCFWAPGCRFRRVVVKG